MSLTAKVGSGLKAVDARLKAFKSRYTAEVKLPILNTLTNY